MHAFADPAAAFYRNSMRILNRAGVPYLVGGGFALRSFAWIHRKAKDFDIFVRPRDVWPVLHTLRAAGYVTDLTYPEWLGKVFHGPRFIDVIFNSRNGLAPVDDEWFEHALPAQVLGVRTLLCPAEETVWSKAFVCVRDRYDGADICHILRARAERMDWDRLLRRFGEHWRILLGHLIHFGYVYPGERARIPEGVMRDLLGRLQAELITPNANGQRLCKGTLLSPEEYAVDVERWGYRNASDEMERPIAGQEPQARRAW